MTVPERGLGGPTARGTGDGRRSRRVLGAGARLDRPALCRRATDPARPGPGGDATQEALVAAWRDLSALRDPDRFEAWLHRLLVRACYREARRARSRPTIDIEVRAIEPIVLDDSLSLADRDELERGFRRLDPEQRAVIVLHFYAGLPVTQVADVLGSPVGTVKSRLHRSIRTLRAALEADRRSPILNEGRPA